MPSYTIIVRGLACITTLGVLSTDDKVKRKKKKQKKEKRNSPTKGLYLSSFLRLIFFASFVFLTSKFLMIHDTYYALCAMSEAMNDVSINEESEVSLLLYIIMEKR